MPKKKKPKYFTCYMCHKREQLEEPYLIYSSKNTVCSKECEDRYFNEPPDEIINGKNKRNRHGLL